MTDHRKRLERLAGGENPVSVYPIRAIDPADDMLEITVFDALQHAADLSKLLSEGERMREAETGYRMALADVAVQAGRYERGEIGGQELADSVGFTARQALGDPEQ